MDAITEQLHRGGALAFWDYAAAGPYLPIDMNPVVVGPGGGGINTLVAKDAVFLSPHKFPGGIGAPGILIAKRRLLRNPVPTSAGGGTVFFVTAVDHRYLSSREEREEGGTQVTLLNAVFPVSPCVTPLLISAHTSFRMRVFGINSVLLRGASTAAVRSS